ncbi:parallel beta helix pectate lyase-like protein [Pseudonocardia hierapolitana]|uniref:Parallel beta helix pectate lyase-like protein n=1 Tax=Pseudonocardia hierapolitana TaxID=1128676 RepID=A0A561T158_9PSEU|nr:parallel beta helix pectate lyase-like protein [Pseudonocardia hierapolitana]
MRASSLRSACIREHAEANGESVVQVRNSPPAAPTGRQSRLWRNLALGAALAAAVLVVVLLVFAPGSTPPPPGPTPPPVATGPQFYVDPAGSDTNDGSQGRPFKTIQKALDEAEPGTTINLAPGEYREQLATQRDGAPGAPITIRGPETGQDQSGRYQATLYGTDRIVSVDHSHYVFEGFTIDGQEKLKGRQFPTDVSAITAFKQSVATDVEDGRLIYIGASDESRDITGIEIRNMFLSGAGGECVRLRNNAHDNVIADSVIQYCGMFGKKSDDTDRFEFHNGEGVYIGTSPKSDSQPMHENDASSGNQVTGNIIRTFGSECFNVKENAHDNVFENNQCSGNVESTEFDGSNIELRGHNNIVRNNTIADSEGVAIKIKSDSAEYDKGGNVVEGNRISDVAAEAFQIESDVQQGQMCGNEVQAATLGEDTPQSVGQPC